MVKMSQFGKLTGDSSGHKSPLNLGSTGIMNGSFPDTRRLTDASKIGEETVDTTSLQVTGNVGHGSYGQVYRAYDPSRKTHVAVKSTQIPVAASYAFNLREFDLQAMCVHPNVLRILELSIGTPFAGESPPQSNDKYRRDSLYIIYPLGQCSLLKIIRDHFSLQYYDPEKQNNLYTNIGFMARIQILVEILLGLENIHSHNILHRDLKPANIIIMINGTSVSAQISDFGISCPITKQDAMSSQVVTSWYRAPEICMGSTNYSKAIDVWSFGCILFEIMSGKALAYGIRDKGEDVLGGIITRLPNKPSQSDADAIKTSTNQIVMANFDKVPKTTWSELLQFTPAKIKDFNEEISSGMFDHENTPFDLYCDLLNKILQINPVKRPTVYDCMCHPFFRPFTLYINSVRSNHPPVVIDYNKIFVHIYASKDREKAKEIFLYIFDNRHKHTWYRHKTLFMAIDIFNRYLYWCQYTKPTEAGKLVYGGLQIHRTNATRNVEQDLILRILGCLYMAIKYYTIDSCEIGFWSIAPNNFYTVERDKEAEEFERFLLTDVLLCRIYRPTIFDVAPNTLSSDIIRRLLNSYLSINSVVIELDSLYKKLSVTLS